MAAVVRLRRGVGEENPERETAEPEGTMSQGLKSPKATMRSLGFIFGLLRLSVLYATLERKSVSFRRQLDYEGQVRAARLVRCQTMSIVAER